MLFSYIGRMVGLRYEKKVTICIYERIAVCIPFLSGFQCIKEKRKLSITLALVWEIYYNQFVRCQGKVVKSERTEYDKETEFLDISEELR